jgi:hypothetical protein
MLSGSDSDGVWVTLANGLGGGTRAAASSAVALGALRASRRSGGTIREAFMLMQSTARRMRQRHRPRGFCDRLAIGKAGDTRANAPIRPAARTWFRYRDEPGTLACPGILGFSGGGGIRTLEPPKRRLTVFETAPGLMRFGLCKPVAVSSREPRATLGTSQPRRPPSTGRWSLSTRLGLHHRKLPRNGGDGLRARLERMPPGYHSDPSGGDPCLTD